jgi:tyrosine-protein kinase Etk/Wzc
MENPTLERVTNNYFSKSGREILVQNFIRHFYENWKWFVLSVFLSLILASLFLRYKTPEYKVSASILVRDDTKGSDFGDAIVLQGLGLASGKSNVDNEVEVLKSRTLAENTVTDLQLNVQYFSKGYIKTTEIYGDSPIILRFIVWTPEAIKEDFQVYNFAMRNNGFTLSGKDKSWSGEFGDTLDMPFGRAILRRSRSAIVPGNAYSIRVNKIDQTVRKYSSAISIYATNKMVSMINLIVKDILPERGEAILSTHIANYLKTSIIDKNRIADSTIAFIDQNLDIVSGDLHNIERDIENFRKTNHLADIDETSRLLLQHSGQTESQRIDNEVQLKLIESLQEYLKKNTDAIVPATLVIHEAGFTELINRYNELQMERGSALLNSTDQHPVVKNLANQITTLRENIETIIDAKKVALKVHISELGKYSSGFRSEIDRIPGKQRIYLDYSRQQQIKQELYIFLLKKRVETSLSKSSTLANGRIIDAPKADINPFSPSRQLTFLLAFLIGLGFPAAIIYAKDLFNTRVQSKLEVVERTGFPIIGELGHKSNAHISVFGEESPHYLTEQFRVLRTSLHQMTGAHRRVVLLTSSMGGEGKSFVSINLAISIAMIGKKVILVEFDFRKPKIGVYLNLKNEGVTDYLKSEKPLTDFIQSSDLSPGFDIITCGSIPSNPVEMIVLPKTKEMIASLTENYDYVFLDTAPIGIVTDAQILSQYAQTTLYVVREEFTFKHQLNDLAELRTKVPNLHIVLNDVKSIRGYDYGYGYRVRE